MQYSIVNYSDHVVHDVPEFIYFMTGSLYLWPPSSYIPAPHLLLLAVTNLIPVSVTWRFLVFWGFFCFVLFSNSKCKWDHTVFVFLWHILLNMRAPKESLREDHFLAFVVSSTKDVCHWRFLGDLSLCSNLAITQPTCPELLGSNWYRYR